MITKITRDYWVIDDFNSRYSYTVAIEGASYHLEMPNHCCPVNLHVAGCK
jgi:hypothetical protein